jgi:hypothetical protein
MLAQDNLFGMHEWQRVNPVKAKVDKPGMPIEAISMLARDTLFGDVRTESECTLRSRKREKYPMVFAFPTS